MDVCLLAVVVYDSGTLFDVSILDITDDDIRARFLQVTCTVTTIMIDFLLA